MTDACAWKSLESSGPESPVSGSCGDCAAGRAPAAPRKVYGTVYINVRWRQADGKASRVVPDPEAPAEPVSTTAVRRATKSLRPLRPMPTMMYTHSWAVSCAMVLPRSRPLLAPSARGFPFQASGGSHAAEGPTSGARMDAHAPVAFPGTLFGGGWTARACGACRGAEWQCHRDCCLERIVATAGGRAGIRGRHGPWHGDRCERSFCPDGSDGRAGDGPGGHAGLS